MGRKGRGKQESQATRAPIQPTTIPGDLRWGAGWGLVAGVVYLVFAAGVLLLEGGMPESATPALGVGALLMTYPLAGIVGGLVVGLLRSSAQSRQGATLVGMLALLPGSAMFALFYAGSPREWGGAGWFAVVGTAVLIGGYGGYKVWDLRDFDPMRREGPIASDPGAERQTTTGVVE